MGGSRAKARTEGIRSVTTDWFLFVDSDVVLCKDWYKKVQADLKGGVAAVWGLNVDVIPNVADRGLFGCRAYLRGNASNCAAEPMTHSS